MKKKSSALNPFRIKDVKLTPIWTDEDYKKLLKEHHRSLKIQWSKLFWLMVLAVIVGTILTNFIGIIIQVLTS